MTSIVSFLFTDIQLAIIKRDSVIFSVSHFFILTCIVVSVTAGALLLTQFVEKIDYTEDSLSVLLQAVTLITDG